MNLRRAAQLAFAAVCIVVGADAIPHWGDVAFDFVIAALLVFDASDLEDDDAC